MSEELRPTEAEVEQNYAFRERYESSGLESLESALPPEIAALSAEQIGAMISQDAHTLVLDFEVDGRKGYERRYQKPCWPKGASGITIGLGYDLGYNTAGEYDQAWKPRLAAPDHQALGRTIGLKGDAAASRLSSVSGIVVPWDAAFAVYSLTTVLKFGRLVLTTFPNALALHPHSFGALFSLVYNRGSALDGDRRREMRNIRDHLVAGRPEKVPQEFRAMKRIWADSGMTGLLKRRDAEARLFEQGLIEADKAKQATPMVVAAAAPATQLESAKGSAGAGNLESLFLELGRRAQLAEKDPDAIGAPQLESLEFFTPESRAALIDYGQRAFARVEQSIHHLLCGDGEGDKNERQSLQNALMHASEWGPDKVKETIAALLAGYLFLIPPINRIVAGILYERVLGPVLAEAGNTVAPLHQNVCRYWARRLQGDEAQAAPASAAPARA